MIKLLLVIALASLLTRGGLPANAQTATQNSRQQLPAAIKLLLDQALAQAQVQYLNYDPVQIDQAGTKFQALLDQVGSQVSPDLARQMTAHEGSDIYAKLTTIAWDRHNRPEAYQEIEQHYLHAPFRRFAHIQASPNLSPQHITEAYRLPWEFFLLRPTMENTSQDYENRVVDAVERINNNASIITLLHDYWMTTREGVYIASSGEVQTRQQRLLGALNSFHNPQGLQAILECVSESDKQQAGKDPEKYGWDVRRLVTDMMTAPQQVGAWRQVIVVYPAQRLNVGHRELLDRVMRPRPQFAP